MITPYLRKVRRWALLPVIAACLYIACETSATAHTRLVESAPLERSILAETPDEIVLRFSGHFALTGISFDSGKQSGGLIGLGRMQVDENDHCTRIEFDQPSTIADMNQPTVVNEIRERPSNLANPEHGTRDLPLVAFCRFIL